MHLYDGLSEECCSEEGFKGNTKVSASNTSEIEEWVRNRSTGQNSPKSVLLHVIVYYDFGSFH